jgi:CheY-like chemotaxis protein
MSAGRATMARRVLIVEDECLVLCLAQSVLQQAGYDTVLAATVGDAQAVITSDQNLDLVFTDIQLGNHSRGGVTIGSLAGQARSGTPVLYTSAQQANGIEPSAFLSKPYSPEQLIGAIGKLLEGKCRS